MELIRFRAPGAATPLSELLRLVLANANDDQRETLVADGCVLLDGHPVRSMARAIPPGSMIEVECHGRWLADEPRFESERFHAFVASPVWWRGRLEIKKRGGASELRFERTALERGVARLTLEHVGGPIAVATVLARLAGAGMPVIGDSRRGGVAVPGGVLIAPADGPDSVVAGSSWPKEAFVDPEGASASAPRWRISPAAARALRRGHPWLLPDEQSDDPARLLPGTLVHLQGEGGRSPGFARIEGAGRIAARLVSGPDAHWPEPVAARVDRALARRKRWLGKSDRGETNALRLVHGEADGLPGIAVDRLGSLLRVISTGTACARWVEPVIDRITSRLADTLGDDPPVLEVLNLPAPDRTRVERVRQLRGEPVALDAHGRMVVLERGLAYLVDPGLGEPERARPGVGLYLDQRENRDRVCRYVRRGGRWLNLFAHTGAFSVALLAAGAEEVVSVDLSRPYLEWLDENLALNAERGVDASRHRSVRRDGRRLLSELAPGERFDGIVLDPPTAAAAGRSFWSVQKDLGPLLREALGRLSPGGVLLACRNHRRAREPLAQLVRGAADEAGVKLAKQNDAGPGADFPRLKGFPEGDSFSGVLVERT